MVSIEVKDKRSEFNERIGFLTAEDKERQLYLHCKIYIYDDNEMSVEQFMHGQVKQYKFQCLDWDKDALFFKGVGRGRKPEWAVKKMRDFIEEIVLTIKNRSIEEFKNS